MKDLEILTWDSEFFNLKVAKCTTLFSQEELLLLLENIKKQQIDLFYFFTNQPLPFSYFDSYTCQLVDEKITYQKEIFSTFLSFPHIFSPCFISQELTNLAIQSGQYSRFKKDKKISQQQFEQLYQLWMQNSVNHQMAEQVLIYQTNQEIQGVVTLQKDGKIGLISVNPTMQRQGIGTALMLAAEQYFSQKKNHFLTVITQKDNVNACLFYEKLGYKQQSLEYVYHFWLKK